MLAGEPIADGRKRTRTREGSGGVSGTEGFAPAKVARSQRHTTANPDSRRVR